MRIVYSFDVGYYMVILNIEIAEMMFCQRFQSFQLSMEWNGNIHRSAKIMNLFSEL